MLHCMCDVTHFLFWCQSYNTIGSSRCTIIHSLSSSSCCNTLQHTATKHTATYCNTTPATHCNTHPLPYPSHMLYHLTRASHNPFPTTPPTISTSTTHRAPQTAVTRILLPRHAPLALPLPPHHAHTRHHHTQITQSWTFRRMYPPSPLFTQGNGPSAAAISFPFDWSKFLKVNSQYVNY